MRFVADSMLGKLARFLRIMGQDVIYLRDAEDTFVLYTAKEERRLLLTKDRGLAEMAARTSTEHLLIHSNSVREQLKEVLEKTGIRPSRPVRCISCNGPIEKVDRGEVEGLVPDFVWQRYTDFWMCRSCGKIYWHGSHLKGLIRFLGYNPWER